MQVVHGSRPQIEARLEARGLVPAYHEGLRITDAPTLDLATRSLSFYVRTGRG